MELALGQLCGKKDVITPLSPEEEHIRRIEYGHRAQNFYVPFSKYLLKDWVIYGYRRRLKDFYDHMSAKEVKMCVSPQVWNGYFKFAFDRNPWDKTLSYYHFCGGEYQNGSIHSFLMQDHISKLGAYDIYSIYGRVALNKIYKYEEMEMALEDISQRLGLKEKITLPAYRAKGDFRTDYRSYREVLEEDEVNIIKTMFAREISLLGYEY